MKDKKVIGITIGDPAGIGPEILLKSILSILKKIKNAIPLIIGDSCVIERNCKVLHIKPQFNQVSGATMIVRKGFPNIFSPGIIKSHSYPVGKNSGVCGRASFAYVKTGVDLWKKGVIDALVTLPISKKAWSMAGINYPGHTDLLKDLLNEKKVAMVMIAGKLRTLLVTTHIPLKDVSNHLSTELIIEKVEIAYEFLTGLGIKNPEIGISALNPHGGEEGVLGKEEKNIIIPAISRLKKKGIHCTGPFPADAIFRKAVEKKIDIIISMYHDQALIPFKTFYSGKLVNFTAGIKMIRTSPGHGTAFDIAYKNLANPSSFLSAYKFAVKRTKNPVIAKESA